MRKDPDPNSLEVCMDGVGADIADAHVIPPPIPKSIALRKYAVRYFIPTVSSTEASTHMEVTATTAEDAVRTVLAAHPEANITSVE